MRENKGIHLSRVVFICLDCENIFVFLGLIHNEKIKMCSSKKKKKKLCTCMSVSSGFPPMPLKLMNVLNSNNNISIETALCS